MRVVEVQWSRALSLVCEVAHSVHLVWNKLSGETVDWVTA